MSYEKIIENDTLLIKVFGIGLILTLSVAPGGLFILLVKSNLFIDLEFQKLVFTSIILSFPFTLVGFFLYLAHPKTIADLFFNNKFNLKERIWAILFSSYLWGFLSVGILYVSTKMSSNPLNHWFGTELKTVVIANYAFMLLYLMIFVSYGIKKAKASQTNISS